MIASSVTAKALTFGLALALHGAVLWGISRPAQDAKTEGASAAIETRLGDSFADMTAGVLTPVPTQTTAIQPTQQMSAAKPVSALPAARPTVQAAPPSQPATAQALAEPSPAQSLRPAARPKSVEAKAPPKAKPKPEKPKTGAKKTTVKGASDGKAKAAAKQKSTGSAATKAKGNAAAQNYPGRVMRKISRVPKPRVGSTGTATVRFTIAANGGLASASIARSSGVASLDRAALKVIQRAAPFPKPPTGAQRSFTLKIKGAP